MPRRAIRSAESPTISRSLRRIEPALGARSPESRLMSVVLPAPLGPITACTSPMRSSSATLLTAARPPKWRESPVTARIGSVIGDLRGAARPEGEPADPARQQEHRQHDEDPHRQQPMLVEAVEDRLVREEILQEREHEGAKDRTEERADAAEDHHHQHAPRLLPAEELGVDVTVLRARQIAGEPRQRSREHEGGELVAE